MKDAVFANQVDHALNTAGIIAQSTQQVVGQSLINFGFGVAVVTALIIAGTFGVMALLERARKHREAYPVNYVTFRRA